jgi:hypothetical protein
LQRLNQWISLAIYEGNNFGRLVVPEKGQTY